MSYKRKGSVPTWAKPFIGIGVAFAVLTVGSWIVHGRVGLGYAEEDAGSWEFDATDPIDQALGLARAGWRRFRTA